MSLKVWLPLDGDLRNLGASKVEVTNNGATVDDAGKIGKCYYFNGSSYLTLPSMSFAKSVSFWVKTTKNSVTSVLFADAGSKMGFGFNTSNSIIVSSASRSTKMYTNSAAINNNVWTHIALVDIETDILLYIDGILQTNRGSNNYFTHNTNNFLIGKRSTGSNMTCYLNDFRVYDHCLSAAEVHEIAQGLVLHYKLDNGSQEIITNIPSTNVYTYPTFNTSSANGGWYHWGPSGHSGSFGQNTDKKYIYNKNNTYSHWITENAGTEKYYLLYQSPAFEGGYRSLQAIIKEENGLPITESICYPNWNARNGGLPNNKWTSIKSLGDGFYYCCCEGISQDGSNDLVGIDVMPGYKIYVSECYLENNVETCSPIFTYSFNTVQDSSGYGHKAQVINAPIISSDTPIYDSCIKLNGSNQAIKVLDNSWMVQGMRAMTINLWVKGSSYTGAHFFSCTESGGFNTEAGSSGYLRHPVHVYTNEAQTSTAYKYDSKEIEIAALSTTNWNMVTFVYDSTGTKTYINGELHHTYTNTSYGIHFNKNARLFLGCEANTASPSTPYFNGSLSDFRLYVTTLTPEDIKALYDVRARVDNLQNIYSYEFNETQSNIFRSELIKPFAKSGATTGIGEITNRNGEPAIVLRQAPFEQNLEDNKSGFLQGYFAPNTSYIFDIWEDTDDVMDQVHGGGGFMIDYTDGTANATLVVDGGNKGFQHVQFITPATKSIDRLAVFGAYNVYYKLNSYICPVGALKIMKNGLFVTSNLNEDDNAALHESGSTYSNEFIEI